MSGWEEILFENRNKNYGAYQLRKKANKYLLVGFLLSLFLVFLIVLTLFVIINSDLFFKPKMPKSITVESLQLTDLLDLRLPEPPPQPDQASQDFSKSVIVDSTLKEKKLADSKKGTLNNDSTSKKETESASSGEGAHFNGDSIIYVHVDKMPVFSGGNEELAKFLRKNLAETAKKSKTRLKIVVQFTVTKTGDTREATIVSGADPEINNDIVRVIGMFPKWEPALQRGRPVGVRFSLFINL
jgi:periplasmic protein TonB